MSEIKGQLLGIIIVLMVFAAVGGTMVALFSNFSGTINDHVDSLVAEGIEDAEKYGNSTTSYTAPGSEPFTGSSTVEP